MGRQSLAGQKRRKQNDQQWPQVIQKSGFGRWRKAQREKIERVIAEQSADADGPDLWRLPQRRDRLGPANEGGKAHEPADRKGDRGQLKGRNFSASHRQG